MPARRIRTRFLRTFSLLCAAVIVLFGAPCQALNAEIVEAGSLHQAASIELSIPAPGPTLIDGLAGLARSIRQGRFIHWLKLPSAGVVIAPRLHGEQANAYILVKIWTF